MIHFIKNIIKATGDYIFTVHCPYCGKVISRKKYACEICKDKFPHTYLTEYAVGGYKCVAPFWYDDIYKKALINFKFHNCGYYSKQLSVMIVHAIKELYGDMEFDVITCVPMHKNTLKDRGYNQARLLATDCAELLNIEYADIIEKHKENKPQHSIDRAHKAKNVKGVYKITDKNLAYGKNILIIDDVITTGNTLGECARILRKAGCKSVSCATLCISRNFVMH